MNRHVKSLSLVLVSLFLLFCLTSGTANALPPAQWYPGAERAFFGHTFAEEYWTNGSIIREAATNVTVQFLASYVNYDKGNGSFQASLVALGVIENRTSGVKATLPYQLLALHYTTPLNKDIFIGALLGFLYAWNETIRNGVPDPGEQRWFLIPYGYNEQNVSKPLTIEAIPATKLGEGHYQFGVRYTNLYARLVDAKNATTFLWTLILPLFEVTLSELTITYDIKVNATSGEIAIETYYVVGQVGELLILGKTISNPQPYLKHIGIGAAHFVVVFASQYRSQTIGSAAPLAAANRNLANITTDAEGRQRAFALATRGDYDVYDESTNPYTLLNSSLPAYSWILTPSLTDLILIGWQLQASADLFCVIAYAMSPNLQTRFTSPRDLYYKANETFTGAAFWYGIAFPEYHGYRVVHDPVYTAYSNIGHIRALPQWLGLAFLTAASMVGIVVLVLYVIKRNGRRNGD
jgi:hypothetical protein